MDSSLRGPGVVAESYDPLFAKLIVSGADREEALARLGRALAEFRVEGISTTLPFYRAILDDEAFVSGELHDGLYSRTDAEPGDTACYHGRGGHGPREARP